ncbi:Rab proteins geranylgeranyltransferase component A [Rhodotorula toruloides]|nr:Rab proteins geranylgeranyltransferase component A [Rhodotorula toruloides]
MRACWNSGALMVFGEREKGESGGGGTEDPASGVGEEDPPLLPPLPSTTAMDPNEPAHFNVLIAGTGLHESILAAALSKAGYSVLQLDSAPYYGTEHASLSLLELHDWASSTPGAEPSSPSPPADLSKLSQRFAISLCPVLLRAKGPGLDLLVRSKVASYLQFGLLGGVGLWQDAERGVARVPASKADVFNDSTLSLVEKRRLTKLLMFAAGEEPFEEDKVVVENPGISFLDYLKEAYSLTGAAASSLAYALALCSSPSDPALPALHRIRSIIHAVGRYGPSPFLVGHYGGAGDLVGGFSRICAVWGGGQILGRPLGPLNPSASRGIPVPASQPPFRTIDQPPPPPSSSSSSDTSTALGIPVHLADEADAEPTTFTADWVVCSPYLFSTLFPAHSLPASLAPDAPRSVRMIAILSRAVSFPRPPTSTDSTTAAEEEEDEDALPDSQLFVFPPGSKAHAEGERVNMGTVTALQTGKGTMSCPEGYHVLTLSAPILAPMPSPAPSASNLVKPYLDALLALASTSTCHATPATAEPDSTRQEPLYSVSYFSPPLPSPSPHPAAAKEADLPPNFLLTPSSPPSSPSSTASLIELLDTLPAQVEESFWKIVGEEGREEGVAFFARSDEQGEEDDTALSHALALPGSPPYPSKATHPASPAPAFYTLLNKPYDAFADEGADEEVVVETKSKKQQQSNHIHIRIQQRNGRKTITTLQGVPTEYDLKKLLKAFKKEFACNGAIIEDEDLGKVIQLQGDQRTKIQEMLIEEGIEKETIKMHGF